MIWIFWISAALIVYSYAGYPFWLWLRSKFFPRPVLSGNFEPRVSLVMVVCNEEKILSAKLENLIALDYPTEKIEIVIASDGSTDQTERMLREYARDSRVQVVLNQLSRGKAASLNDAIEIASGEILVFTDARQMIEARQSEFPSWSDYLASPAKKQQLPEEADPLDNSVSIEA